MMNKIMETFAKMLFRINNDRPESSESERPVDEDPLSACCSASFTYPGWPDSDFCSQCHEHSGIYKDDDVEAKTIGVEDGKS